LYFFLYRIVSNFILYKKFFFVISWFSKIRLYNRILSFKDWLYKKWFIDKYSVNIKQASQNIYKSIFITLDFSQSKCLIGLDFLFSRNYGLSHVNNLLLTLYPDSFDNISNINYLSFITLLNIEKLRRLNSINSLKKFWYKNPFKARDFSKVLWPGQGGIFIPFIRNRYIKKFYKRNFFFRDFWRSPKRKFKKARYFFSTIWSKFSRNYIKYFFFSRLSKFYKLYSDYSDNQKTNYYFKIISSFFNPNLELGLKNDNDIILNKFVNINLKYIINSKKKKKVISFVKKINIINT